MSEMSKTRKAIRRLLLKLVGDRLAMPGALPRDVDFTSARRILVVRQHDRLSDLLFSLPALRAIRKTAPFARITIIANRAHAQVLRNHEFVDEVLAFGPSVGQWDVVSIWRFIKRLRRRYDLAVVLNTDYHSLLSDLLARFSRARQILGSAELVFDAWQHNQLYSLRAPAVPFPQHQADRNLQIMRYVGFTTSDLSSRIHLSSDEFNQACEHLLHQGVKYRNFNLGIHLDSEPGEEEWPVHRLVQVARHFSRERSARIIAIWTGRGAERGLRFLEGLPFAPIICGDIELRKQLGIMACCDAVVCCNLDAMGMAAGLRIPMVGLFGKKDPRLWKPVGERFLALQGRDRTCLDIHPDAVIQAVSDMTSAFPKPAESSNSGFDISEQALDDFLGFGDIRETY